MNETHTQQPPHRHKSHSLRGEAPQKQGLKKRRNGKKLDPAKRAKSNAKRAALVASSQEAKQAIVLLATTTGEELTVNEYLMAQHRQATGCTDFRTFAQWKKDGFAVKKGERSFDIWGTPRRAKTADGVNDDGEKEEGTAYELFPVCSLFNERQVEKTDRDLNQSAQGKADAVRTQKVPVAEFRDSIRHLARCFHVDRQACKGERETAYWATITRRVLAELRTLECARATTGDLAQRNAIIETVEHWCAAHPEPTPPDTDTKKPARDVDSAEPANRGREESTPLAAAPSAFVTGDFEARQDARKARLSDRAERARRASVATYKHAKDMAGVIPFGQPILVGHHSEARDRRYRHKIHNTFAKAFDLDSKAEHGERRAASVGTAGIASNDPEAFDKLTAKLEQLEAAQAVMKSVNVIVRKAQPSDEQKCALIVERGLLSEAQAREILRPDHSGRVGFASYSLSNNNATIRQTRQRIEGIERLRNSEPVEFSNDHLKIDTNEGQIRVVFAGGKPTAQVRTLLKQSGFKWSRYQTAWVRKATLAAVSASKQLIPTLQEFEGLQ